LLNRKLISPPFRATNLPVQAVKERQVFERIVVSRDEALAMFQENKFKVEIISDLPKDAVISCYRNGPMVDLCHGPHVPNTGLLKAVGVNSMSRAFWRADVNREPLQASLRAPPGGWELRDGGRTEVQQWTHSAH
jgi:threonyl-tRNA synthetase